MTVKRLRPYTQKELDKDPMLAAYYSAGSNEPDRLRAAFGSDTKDRMDKLIEKYDQQFGKEDGGYLIHPELYDLLAGETPREIHVKYNKSEEVFRYPPRKEDYQSDGYPFIVFATGEKLTAQQFANMDGDGI